jgi:hypothetical protein
MDAFDRWPERTELGEKRCGHEVPTVEDEVRGGDQADTFAG